jgi:hypothetical protein
VLHGPGPLLQLVPLVHWPGGGHVGAVEQAPAPSQKVSHRQESWQLMPPVQLLSPPHSTRHTPAPQVIGPWQVSVLVLSMRQLRAWLQSIAIGQAPTPPHSTLHAQPAGHTTAAAHEPAAAQLMLQVPVAQLVHSGGHAVDASGLGAPSGVPGGASAAPASLASMSEPATTQKPSAQVRPAAQSRVVAQAKSSDLCWIEQPPARTTNRHSRITAAPGIRTGQRRQRWARA